MINTLSKSLKKIILDFWFKSPIHNQRGDAMMVAIMAIVVCTISSTVMLYNGYSIREISKRPRIKSQMLSVESKVRSALMSPSSYSNCETGELMGDDGKAKCALKIAEINSLGRVIPEARCTAPCGIRVTADPLILETEAGVANAVARARVTIQYEGQEAVLKPVVVDMRIPSDVLQEKGVFKCPDTKPVFKGLNADGTLNCLALPDLAGPGEFANRIDLLAMTIDKKLLPNSWTCPAGKIIRDFSWADGGNVLPDPNLVCVDRPNALTVFGFEPRVDPSGLTGDVKYTPNPDYP